MVNKKFVVKLSGEERERLREVISRGKAKAKIILKARILLKADQGWSDAQICRALDTNIAMVARVRETLVAEGLDAVLAVDPFMVSFRRGRIDHAADANHLSARDVCASS